ncbi:MAG: hypothetical protein GFH27_549331n29 [Chloroflexi bacterium AL-W]|nr:hypothetical protein [Chloroflexi bacterium AL-N1]NOK70330.1 hypothetical protein [Chloroflexi bacterium AL-N10]NOK78008.1 hypothetical protein [Chloroflexi bacterium AL-N5]NOK85107.1 hypothetical protein [Chloroflexi bacterium AL-W]NOK92096.1 hypothetical protein [Chloroflexi bacterium AL-N15]
MRRVALVCAVLAGIGLLGWQFTSIAQVVQPSVRYASPLATYPGFGHDLAADEARFDRESMARELLIEQCMVQKGYAYEVVPPIRASSTVSSEEIVTAMDDPNVRHAESLSVEQREDYYMTLYGVADPNALGADELYDKDRPGGGGCQGEAFATVPGVYAVRGQLNEAYIELRRTMTEDTRVHAAEEAWSACMADLGYPYNTPRDLLAEMDEATLTGNVTEVFEQQHRQATEDGRACGAKTNLDATIAEVRAELEGTFIEEHQVVLDQHVENLSQQDVVLNQVFEETE